jgi:hypothetical protein
LTEYIEGVVQFLFLNRKLGLSLLTLVLKIFIVKFSVLNKGGWQSSDSLVIIQWLGCILNLLDDEFFIVAGVIFATI